ncbi:MAG: beta-lactamase family protein [Chloroflexi bacterium]|nr:beta-lactamase family protein [Chloroflexota bacterium]
MTLRIREVLNRHPTVGLALGLVRDGRLEFFHGHGMADMASATPITEDTIFRIASITKTFTAIAVMQLWEQGLVDLDGPANDYLRAYKLVPADAGWQPATVRNLLTHTAGLPETIHPWDAFLPDWGESVKAGRPRPSLAQFYGGHLRVSAQPGTRFVYGNHGPATLGQLVEDVSGMALDRYVREHIFKPLGMTDSDLLRSEQVRSRLATGYEFGSAGPKAVTERDMITAGAASIYSSPRDMARYVAALLGGGANEHGSILRPATLATMYEPQYQPDPRIPGLGLAFFRVDLGGHRAVEHQGTLPGFHSQVFLAPEDGVGVMAFTNGSVNPDFWLPAECAGLLSRLLDVPDDAIRPDIPQHPESWAELCGWYQLSAGLADVRLRSFVGVGVEVFVRGGQLMIRLLSPVPALFRGFPLRPDDLADPDIFRIDMSRLGPFSMRVAFGREPGLRVTSANLDLMPISLRKQPARTNPRRWATGALAGLGVAAAAAAMRRRGSTTRGRGGGCA